MILISNNTIDELPVKPLGKLNQCIFKPYEFLSSVKYK